MQVNDKEIVFTEIVRNSPGFVNPGFINSRIGSGLLPICFLEINWTQRKRDFLCKPTVYIYIYIYIYIWSNPTKKDRSNETLFRRYTILFPLAGMTSLLVVSL